MAFNEPPPPPSRDIGDFPEPDAMGLVFLFKERTRISTIILGGVFVVLAAAIVIGLPLLGQRASISSYFVFSFLIIIEFLCILSRFRQRILRIDATGITNSGLNRRQFIGWGDIEQVILTPFLADGVYFFSLAVVGNGIKIRWILERRENPEKFIALLRRCREFSGLAGELDVITQPKRHNRVRMRIFLGILAALISSLLEHLIT